MAFAMMNSIPVAQRTTLTGTPLATRVQAVQRSRSAFVVRANAADGKLWAPGVDAPDYLEDLPASYGFDPLRLGANPDSLKWYRQAELQNGRWAMLGVAGILVQEILKPNTFFYNAGLPENLPNLYFGGPDGKANLGGLLAWEFLLFHFVEVRRWQDIKNHHSVDEDPIFKGNKVPNEVQGYPGGIFDPFNFAKGDFKELQTKELKNARLAMVAFVGFILQAQATGKGPLASLSAHLSDPFNNNILKNIGVCHIPKSVTVEGLTIPLTCLWPGQQL